jgi:hypothetical protein
MEKSMGSLSLTDRKLVIGIDFGTTFTGVAWAETRRVRPLPFFWLPSIRLVIDGPDQPDHISVIESWPAHAGTHEGMSSVKVPTELRYTTSNGTENIEWGFQVPALVDRYQWFKLYAHCS